MACPNSEIAVCSAIETPSLIYIKVLIPLLISFSGLSLIFLVINGVLSSSIRLIPGVEMSLPMTGFTLAPTLRKYARNGVEPSRDVHMLGIAYGCFADNHGKSCCLVYSSF